MCEIVDVRDGLEDDVELCQVILLGDVWDQRLQSGKMKIINYQLFLMIRQEIKKDHWKTTGRPVKMLRTWSCGIIL